MVGDALVSAVAWNGVTGALVGGQAVRRTASSGPELRFFRKAAVRFGAAGVAAPAVAYHAPARTPCGGERAGQGLTDLVDAAVARGAAPVSHVLGSPQGADRLPQRLPVHPRPGGRKERLSIVRRAPKRPASNLAV